MKPHYMIGECDGHLYDCRDPRWHQKPPLRRNYRRTFTEIKNVAQLKATLRAGGHAWPGGYPLFFITNDGCTLSFEAVLAKPREFFNDIWAHDRGRIAAVEINYEDAELTCAETGKPIPAAYT